MYLALLFQTSHFFSRISGHINRFHIPDSYPSRNLLILNDFLTLHKTPGVAPPSTSPSPVLDLPWGARYCANETPVASQPHLALPPVPLPVCPTSLSTGMTQSTARPEWSSLVSPFPVSFMSASPVTQ